MASSSNTRTATPPTASSNTQAPTAARQKKMQHKQPTSFQFVTFGDVDHMRDSNALSRIRRHAMKDIGLQRRKPKKKRFVEVFDIEQPPTNSDGSTEDEHAVARASSDLATAEEDVVPSLPSPIVPAIGGGGIHSFLKLPIDLSTDPTGKSLLANIFIDDPTNTVSRQTAHRNDWFFAGLKDPASFNQILANSELHTEALRHPERFPRETEVSIRYHQRAVRSLRKRLIEDGGISDEMIGIASGFVVYAEIAGNLDWWLPQRKGMVDLITIRGGSTALEYHPRLIATCSWVELRGCYMQDLKPLLPLPRIWTEAYEAEFQEMEPLFAESERNVFEAHWKFPAEWPVEIFDGVANLADKVQKRLEDGNEEGEDVLVWTNVVVHRLLNLRPDENLLEAIRLGLLLFIASIHRHYGAHPTNPRILVRKLHDTLLREDIEWGIFWQLRLWILCIAAFEAVEQYDLDFFVAAIVEVRRSMPESETQGVIEATKIVLWLPKLMHGRVGELVQRVEEMGRYM